MKIFCHSPPLPWDKDFILDLLIQFISCLPFPLGKPKAAQIKSSTIIAIKYIIKPQLTPQLNDIKTEGGENCYFMRTVIKGRLKITDLDSL